MAMPVSGLEPIENLWFELKRAVRMRTLKDIKDLEIFCMAEWSKIPPSVFSNLKNIIYCQKSKCHYPSKGRLHKALKPAVPIILTPINLR